MVIEDEEIKKVAPPTAKVMEILEFVKTDQVDPIYLETSYYMAPDEPAKSRKRCCSRRKESGLVRVSPRSRCTIASTWLILRPGDKGVLCTPCITDEIRKVDEFRTDSKLGERERAGAGEQPNLRRWPPISIRRNIPTSYRDNLKGLIRAKVEGRETVEPRTLAPSSTSWKL